MSNKPWPSLSEQFDQALENRERGNEAREIKAEFKRLEAEIASLQSRLSAAESRIAADGRELEGLRKALKPFAHYFDLNDCKSIPDDNVLEVPVGDLRHARAVLKEKP